jgi:hypothetical protein
VAPRPSLCLPLPNSTAQPGFIRLHLAKGKSSEFSSQGCSLRQHVLLLESH